MLSGNIYNIVLVNIVILVFILEGMLLNKASVVKLLIYGNALVFISIAAGNVYADILLRKAFVYTYNKIIKLIVRIGLIIFYIVAFLLIALSGYVAGFLFMGIIIAFWLGTIFLIGGKLK